ncbi:glycosyltransferase family 2 protein [Fervidobacterium thailandense]|uniref:Glycosyltransferase 2-like domain-containing protein n=1 Tax=Fervidobacterium thailandense TaxID=1008305 RepID=A0A1E3G0R0_9BACT|nr:glycosyltransferase [Fervidobacterium thailandense]ODN29836.1 hypothetical protein A4H02_08480 [Fervidobacterium thailandense]
MANEPLVSVIIPAYNVEKYITRTLESVLDQTFRDFEIILVNDGSTDKTEEVAKKLLKSAELNFRIISQSNKGVSVARNVGLYNSAGRYVKFLDADDVMKRESLQYLVEACENNKLAFAFGKQDVINQNGKIMYTYDQMYLADLELADYKVVLEQFLKGILHISCNSSIFRKDIITERNLTFTPGARFGEDTEFIAKYIFFAKKIAFVDKVVCEAVVRFDSSTKVSNLAVFHNVGSFKRLYRFFMNFGELEIARVIEEYSIPASYAWAMGNLAYNAFPYRLWKKLLENDTIGAMMRRLKIDFPKQTSYHSLLKLAKHLYLISPAIAYFVLRLVGKWHRWRNS